jgi:membrane fusion protein, heavy metal efflux system
MKRIVVALRNSGAALLALCAVVGLWMVWHRLFETEVAGELQIPAGVAEMRSEVKLSDVKMTQAAIKLGQVILHDLRETTSVAGRLSYDKSKHISIRAAASGNVSSYLVKPGDSVEEGDVLLKLSCPEIGQARASERRQQAELQLLVNQLEFLSARREGVEQLISAIYRSETPEQIRQAYSESNVGSAREVLLSAYSSMLLAKSQLERVNAAATQGAIAGRTAAQRSAEYEAADAGLRGSIEQLLYDAKQEVAKAKAAVDSAQRQFELARQQTASLLGYTSADRIPAIETIDEGNLAMVEVRAPIAGTVEQRFLADSERVQAGENLLVLADTKSLWVEAQIRESHWRAISLQANDSLTVTLPAVSESLDAKVHFVGREVDPMTNSIPIIATLQNNGRLRPGLFANVNLPLGEARRCLAVPQSAITVHESENFVFVPLAENVFSRRIVQVGQTTGGFTEVLSGLALNDTIVTEGVFYLKSELLLEAEE